VKIAFTTKKSKKYKKLALSSPYKKLDCMFWLKFNLQIVGQNAASHAKSYVIVIVKESKLASLTDGW